MNNDNNNVYVLTIHYIFPDGNKASESYSKNYVSGDLYKVYSPVISGYTSSKNVVSGVMPKRNVSITIIYSIKIYTLKINYKFQNGIEAAPKYINNFRYAESYEVISPIIEGYSCTKSKISGKMPNKNLTITVMYVPISNLTEISDDLLVL